MEINEAMVRHYTWLETMGWDDASRPIEKLGLVASEIGEAAAELPEGHPTKAKLMGVIESLGRAVNACRTDDNPRDNFGTELADIVLRVMGIAAYHRIDLEARIEAKMALNLTKGNRGRSI